MILVTGGTGLLGAHLLYALCREQDEVRAVYRSEHRLEAVRKIFGYYTDDVDSLFGKIHWYPADLTDRSDLEGAFHSVRYVYHAAAMVSFDPADKKKVMENNAESTANIVNLCLENEVNKLCFVSSTSAIGRPAEGEMASENNLWKGDKNRSFYSVSKFRSEMEVWRGIAEGLNAVIVNPSIIIGPGDWSRSSSNLFLRICKGMKFYTMGVTGYVDVRDVVSIMISLMRQEISGERFIVSAENLSYKEVFESIAKSLNRKPPEIRASRIMLEIAWRLDWLRSITTGRSRQISREAVRAANTKAFFSNAKVSDQTGIRFKPISQSIEDTAGFFLQEAR